MVDNQHLCLGQREIDTFWRDGYVCVENALSPEQLAALRAQLDTWIEESRHHPGPFGETFDGRPRFDVAPSHCVQSPALRRVDNPQCVSEVFAQVAFDSRLTDMVADLIGPNVKFHHAKINAKLPGNETRVEYHQDFPYTPHTNDDLVTALLLLDDMDQSNGPLQVVPGSHTEGVKSLWDGETFTGKVDAATTADCNARATTVTGRAGSVCFMHTSVLHGSAENYGQRRRALFISVFSAADAVPLARSPVPNEYEGRIVRGHEARTARLTFDTIELPAGYRAASFFSVQQAESAR
jgi:ectoine hydroxylase-related dioxygenase (phytanoyl-CoA dioxygenase family)